MVFEIQPQFSNERVPRPKLNVDTDLLGSRIRRAVESVIQGRNIVVDVTSRNVGSPVHEWRVNIPPREPEIYVAVSRILSHIQAMYSAHLRCGDLSPQEFTIHVWCRPRRHAPIIGSID